MVTTIPRGLGLTALPAFCSLGTARTRVMPTPRLVAARASYGSDSPSDSPSSVPDTLPVAGIDTDWREFRARLVASTAGEPSLSDSDEPWAHSITLPEEGSLILASPLFFSQSQTYFNQAVILLVQHDPLEGSIGLILNKPLEYKVADVNKSGALSTLFDPCTLYLGGDVNRERVNIVHGVGGLDDTREVLPGVFLGGQKGLEAALQAGEVSPHEIKVCCGLAGWGPGQLESEIRRGVWITAAASRHLVLAPAVVGSGEETWHATLQLMGGDYAGLSEAMKESLRPDIMGFDSPLNGNRNASGANEGGGSGDGGGASSSGPTIRRDPGHNNGSGI